MFQGNERILAFIDRKGGVTKVAKAIGKHPTLFYNIEKKGTIPNMETLALIKEKYSDFDLNWVAVGEIQENGLTRIKLEPSEIEKKLKYLEEENQKLKMQLEKVETEKSALFNILGKSKSMIQSPLVDDEFGYNLMNKIQENYQSASHAFIQNAA